MRRMSGAGTRLGFTTQAGAKLADSWQWTGPTYELRDPATQPWRKSVARALDRGFNALVGAKPVDDFAEPADDRRRPGRRFATPGPAASQSNRSATRPT